MRGNESGGGAVEAAGHDEVAGVVPDALEGGGEGLLGTRILWVEQTNGSVDADDEGGPRKDPSLVHEEGRLGENTHAVRVGELLQSAGDLVHCERTLVRVRDANFVRSDRTEWFHRDCGGEQLTMAVVERVEGATQDDIRSRSPHRGKPTSREL